MRRRRGRSSALASSSRPFQASSFVIAVATSVVGPVSCSSIARTVVPRASQAGVSADEQAERPRPITGGGHVASLLHQFRFGHAVHRFTDLQAYPPPR